VPSIADRCRATTFRCGSRSRRRRRAARDHRQDQGATIGALNDKAVLKRARPRRRGVATSTPEELQALMQADYARYALVKILNIKD
jgi:hypothetical protein